MSLADRYKALSFAPWLVIEFCAPVESSMRAASENLGWVNVLTVSERDDGASQQTMLELKAICALQIRRKGYVFLWASTPCTGGLHTSACTPETPLTDVVVWLSTGNFTETCGRLLSS